MSRLINAGLARLFKNRVFYGVVIFAAVFGIIQGMPGRNRDVFYLDSMLVAFSVISGMVSALFTGLFLGTEYSDGTVRNKLIVGHGRLSIYISGFIVSCIANLIFTAVYYVCVLAVGLAMGGEFQADMKIIAVCALCGMMIAIASTAVMTLLGYIITSRSRCITACFLIAICLVVGSAYINGKLEEPEFYDQYIVTNENGVPSQVESVPNPNYVDGTERKVLETVLQLIPNGQAIMLTSMFDEAVTDEVTDALYRWMGYSALFTAVVTIAGTGLFRRKNIN